MKFTTAATAVPNAEAASMCRSARATTKIPMLRSAVPAVEP